jgi:hypothetical protein
LFTFFLNEFVSNSIPSTETNNQLAIGYLGDGLLSPAQVISLGNSLDWYYNLILVQMPPHHHINGIISGHTVVFQLSVFVALHFEVEIGALHLCSDFVNAPQFLGYGCDWSLVFTVDI